MLLPLSFRLSLGIFILTGLIVSGCAQTTSEEPAQETPRLTPTPTEFKKGEFLFNTHCAKCHGRAAVGTDLGPPLVDKIYEPNHHGDSSFHRAAQIGVRAHHWSFGNMPPVAGVTSREVDSILKYVRWLQREAGIE